MKYIKNPITQVVLLVVLIISIIVSAFNKGTETKTEIKSYTPAIVANSVTRPLGTAFLISDQRAAIAAYNVPITNTATLILGNSGQVLLQKKTGTGAWTTISTGPSSVGSGLVYQGTSSQTVFGGIAPGDSVKIISNNLVGTPTYGTPVGMELQIN